jgi:hypothetical protein
MKRQLNPKVKRLVAVTLLLLTCVMLFAGCSSVPADTSQKDNAYNSSYSSSSNKMCVIWKDNVISAPGVTAKGLMLFQTGEISYSATEVGGSPPHNITFIFRDIAKMMYSSVLGTHPSYNSDTDKFDGTNWSLTLHPQKLIYTVNEKTMELLDGGVDTIDTVLKSLQAIAAGILLAVWSMGFISQIVNEKFSMETLLKTLMQLLCGVVLVLSAKDIITAFIDLGNELLSFESEDTVNIGMTAFKSELDGYMMKLTTMSFGISFLTFVQAGITAILDLNSFVVIAFLAYPFFGQFQCAVKIVSKLITRWLELVVRISMAPVVFAFSAQNGFTQESIRFIRATFACAIQPVLMMIGALVLESIVTICLSITSSTLDSVTGPVAAIALGVAYTVLNAYIGGTDRMAQEIVAR